MAKKKNKKKSSQFTAETADRHELYQLSVQAPEHEVATLEGAYRKAFGKKPLSMREDFCGTALLSSAWVESHKKRVATGVDICEKTLSWGKKHNVAPLGEAASRLTLLNDDVRTKRGEKFQVINALNFSYWVFATRKELVTYFKAVRASLEKEGLFFMDAYGGWESQQPMLEPREIAAGFDYIWDQDSFDP
ncbi:MAG: class I SAM-dependent methyltransferase, partial [Polyangiaceae bacterium]|nr:class I SAM-dependent methyltransferase [Polyangiaceae bacterium]